jgi:hypothetical protein
MEENMYRPIVTHEPLGSRRHDWSLAFKARVRRRTPMSNRQQGAAGH